jgi:SHS2 domain-containing protein
VTYRHVDHTADLGLEVEGGDLPELFAEAARGFAETVTDAAAIPTTEEGIAEIDAPDVEALFHRWLAELLYLFDATGILYSGAAFERLTETGLRARISGGRFDPARHAVRREIKAVTLHGLRVRQSDDRWQALVIFDI